MATWREVQERVRREHALARDEADSFAVTIERAEVGGVRAQKVMVRRYKAWGHDMLEVRSAFAEAADYEGRDLLPENLRMPIGAMARHGQYLVVVHKTPLAHVSVDGVLFLLTRISELADLLEQRTGGDRF